MADLCRKHNIAPSTFCTWKEKFVEGGKNTITGDAHGKHKSGVGSNGALQKENDDLKKIVEALTLANNLFKKTLERGVKR